MSVLLSLEFFHQEVKKYFNTTSFMDKKKIGVLLPQSKQHPIMAKEFMNGLRLSIPNSNYKLIIEGIGFGNNPKNIINASQKLINQEEVMLTTGILGHKELNSVIDYFEEMEEPLIYADFGANKSIDISNRQNSYCNSLNLYNATHALGKYFIENGFKNIGSSTCYYESGYGFIEAMHDSLSENNEGQFSGYFITPLNPRDNEAELMSQYVTETKPDALFAFHNGIYAEEHANYLNKNKVNNKTPLFTLPFSVDKKVLAKFPKTFEGTKCVSPWCIELDTDENKKFITAYLQKHNKEPSVFAMLGYENGLLIDDYLNNNNMFSHKRILGPRGELNNFKNTGNRTISKQYLWLITWENNTYKFNFLEELKTPIKNNYLKNNNENGWYNAYLCH